VINAMGASASAARVTSLPPPPARFACWPGEQIPEGYVIQEIRNMRRSGNWNVMDIAWYNRVSEGAVHILSDDCALPIDETKIDRILFPA